MSATPATAAASAPADPTTATGGRSRRSSWCISVLRDRRRSAGVLTPTADSEYLKSYLSSMAKATTDGPTSVFTLAPYPGAPKDIFDTYLLPSVVFSSFAPDVPHAQAAVLAATQDPTSLIVLVGHPGAVAAVIVQAARATD